MHIALATFEYLPVRVGGLAEAVTSLAEALGREGEDEVSVFMPAHGLLQNPGPLSLEKFAGFAVTVGGAAHPVSVYQVRQNGVRLFLFSGTALDSPGVYAPRELFMQKMIHFTNALPGLINLLIKKEQHKPHILHLNDWHCVFAGALVKKYFRIPLVFTIHRLGGERFPVRDLNEVHLSDPADPRCLEGEMLNIELFGAHQCDALITVSRSYLDEEWPHFFSAFQGKATYVFNGIDAAFWDPARLDEAGLPRGKRRLRLQERLHLDGGCLFFNVGRLDASQKGIDTLLKAFELLMEGSVEGYSPEEDPVCLYLVGSGNPFLEAEARRLQSRYPGRVKAEIGYLSREENREAYGAADFCLVPSNFEPFGLVQMEAMCMGCIPIGSGVGGIKDTVIDPGAEPKRATGWLVPPRDAPALARAMAGAARMLKKDTPAIEQMRKNGRAHVVENFSWEQAARRYRAVYRDQATLKLPFVTYAEPY